MLLLNYYVYEKDIVMYPLPLTFSRSCHTNYITCSGAELLLWAVQEAVDLPMWPEPVQILPAAPASLQRQRHRTGGRGRSKKTTTFCGKVAIIWVVVELRFLGFTNRVVNKTYFSPRFADKGMTASHFLRLSLMNIVL